MKRGMHIPGSCFLGERCYRTEKPVTPIQIPIGGEALNAVTFGLKKSGGEMKGKT